MSRHKVSSWPTYLLHDVPEETRYRLSEEAQEQDVSVADVVRGIFCARYNLRCPPASYRYEPDRDTGATSIIVRLQPKLHRALKAELAEPGHATLRGIMLDALEAHYEGGHHEDRLLSGTR